MKVSVSDHNEQETNGKNNWELRKLNLKSAAMLASDYCFLEEHRRYFQNFNITNEQCLLISNTFEPVCSNIKSSPEKFYSQYFKLSMECLVFENIPKQVSMLLFSELATLCLEYNMNGNKSTHVAAEVYHLLRKIFVDLNIFLVLFWGNIQEIEKIVGQSIKSVFTVALHSVGSKNRKPSEAG